MQAGSATTLPTSRQRIWCWVATSCSYAVSASQAALGATAVVTVSNGSTGTAEVRLKLMCGPHQTHLCAVAQIDEAKIETVKNIAWDTPVRNETADYSCQDFVLNVLNSLEDEGMIDAEDGDYQKNKNIIKAKRESWQ
ncbi:hypothetical protein GX51_04465 [Blastomyces parvus]|uniref:Uncharacterized protein n=1 Tax=Blastomyces parvus TaxID=2060905 RepID=A0A2B7X1S2_9EURO|nr:hypothetical protein GX51_04465 [Blastomyces parvus]